MHKKYKNIYKRKSLNEEGHYRSAPFPPRIYEIHRNFTSRSREVCPALNCYAAQEDEEWIFSKQVKISVTIIFKKSIDFHTSRTTSESIFWSWRRRECISVMAKIHIKIIWYPVTQNLNIHREIHLLQFSSKKKKFFRSNANTQIHFQVERIMRNREVIAEEQTLVNNEHRRAKCNNY